MAFVDEIAGKIDNAKANAVKDKSFEDVYEDVVNKMFMPKITRQIGYLTPYVNLDFDLSWSGNRETLDEIYYGYNDSDYDGNPLKSEHAPWTVLEACMERFCRDLTAKGIDAKCNSYTNGKITFIMHVEY